MAGANQRLFVLAAQATREETQKQLAALGRREHARVMQDDPRPARFTRTVDGVRGAQEEQVRADGTIIYEYPRLDDVVRFAMETLFDLSPVLSGEYRLRHQLFVGGVEARNLSDWDGASEILITNPLPYSRKIEMSTMTMRVPGTDRVYEEAASVVAARYGNTARVQFGWQGVVGGATASGLVGNKSINRFPTLFISER
ncbi:hypothetical protein [Devosia sp. A449]